MGGLNLWFNLATVAWLGRLSSWLLIALGWCYFCRSLTQRWGVAWVSGLVFLLLQHFGHLAGEWIIGGVEAKGFAFGFVFFGLGRMVRGGLGDLLDLVGTCLCLSCPRWGVGRCCRNDGLDGRWLA